jgi:hypothetical protein
MMSQSVWSQPSATTTTTSTSLISHQGRLADASGEPLSGQYDMELRIYEVPTGGTHLWEEYWTGSNSVEVSDGLFNVMLGSINNTLASAIAGHNELYLGITVGTDGEMSPRVQLGSVPFAMHALTVADGSVTTEKIEDGAVTSAKLDVDNGLEVSGDFTVSNGYVGVGTTSPGASLEINGGPYWTTVNWRKAIKIGNANAIQFTANPTIYGIGASSSGNALYFMAATGEDQNATRTYPMVMDNDGLRIYGNFTATGTKSAVVDTAHYGQRKLYAFEQASNRFGDEGKAELVNGVAIVTLDPIFLETIEGDFLIHVTPYGDASLYVAEIGEDYFQVKAREGHDDVAFAWMLTAPRKGYADVRLEQVETTNR